MIAIPTVLLALLLSSAPSAQDAPPRTLAPACAGPESRALDFWIGEWAVEWRAADGRSGQARSTVVLENGGCVIREHFRGLAGGLEGTGIYSYFAPIRAWSQAWMDNQGITIHATGGVPNEADRRFELRLARGPDPGQQYRTLWEDVTAAGFTWRFQTRSGEDGAWTDQGVSYYRRICPEGVTP